jgi:hypothetical protein
MRGWQCELHPAWNWRFVTNTGNRSGHKVTEIQAQAIHAETPERTRDKHMKSSGSRFENPEK